MPNFFPGGITESHTTFLFDKSFDQNFGKMGDP
jgi:hypothetical protein